jgi:hypothetical protein
MGNSTLPRLQRGYILACVLWAAAVLPTPATATEVGETKFAKGLATAQL